MQVRRDPSYICRGCKGNGQYQVDRQCPKYAPNFKRARNKKCSSKKKKQNQHCKGICGFGRPYIGNATLLSDCRHGTLNVQTASGQVVHCHTHDIVHFNSKSVVPLSLSKVYHLQGAPVNLVSTRALFQSGASYGWWTARMS
ncbi:BZ3500_MvSof-1268-A1-R1_Chr1-1g01182 [Microbotryum saponariae]|uniref:BZ3500_MvSof-1268-A1-R1_Chr1-1g01182 protein n=1 Tax=Microbotryum saponariae TaxID=289078 RepID=A0A2X0KQ27_9BASI|nr:BZ3500_MvSof-1268-A1-R1_Chr1-1g01182 [Microbotryum saponariae]SCZ93596.1 BZ3501_MvSof-1269-A2-R1_Chr1-1g00778 [Microbotryum saponariae]